jgi:hypothetical protein
MYPGHVKFSHITHHPEPKQEAMGLATYSIFIIVTDISLFLLNFLH